MSLYEIPSQLHHYLRHYKDNPSPRRQREASTKTISLLCHFLGHHSDCIARAGNGSWDLITAVPSTSGRTGEHPFVAALRQVPDFFARYESLLRRGSGQLGHNQASDDGYVPTRAMSGERVLLVDDTFTSGARSQSAASALNNAGAEVVALIPIGRVIKPSYNELTNQYWSERQREAFTFDTCCLECD